MHEKAGKMKTTHESRKYMKEDKKKNYVDLVQNKRDRNTERYLHEPTTTPEEKSPVALAIKIQLFHK